MTCITASSSGSCGVTTCLQSGEPSLASARLFAATTRRLRHSLAALAGDVVIKDELRRHAATNIFDESLPLAVPTFQVRAYRRGLRSRLPATHSEPFWQTETNSPTYMAERSIEGEQSASSRASTASPTT